MKGRAESYPLPDHQFDPDGTVDRRPDKPSSTDAENLAIAALSFVAADSELLPRFLAITGIAPRDIRRAAAEPGFLAGVLDFILAHEPTLIAFCDQTGFDPARVAEARRVLPLGDDRHERSP